MMIQNLGELSSSKKRKIVLSIIEKGIEASLPCKAIVQAIGHDFVRMGEKRISLKKYSDVYLIATGKSADLMANAADSCTRISGGIIVQPSKVKTITKAKKFKVIQSGHPLPSQKSVIAAKMISRFVESLEKSALVIFLISGGTSSLVSMPDGISLKEKRRVNELLLKAGANIKEINCVRKHLSGIKGGKLMGLLNCDAISLVMSDVVDDDLSVIASGMTYCDHSTFSEAKKVLQKYRLVNLIPRRAWTRIMCGGKGAFPETPKRPRIKNQIILSNKDCVKAMERHAKRLGLQTKVIWSLEGNVKDAAIQISRKFPACDNCCVIFGGETTVIVKGNGKGGRNQELVLNLLKNLHGQKEEAVVASVGTDGVDGNTLAAGAIADLRIPFDGIEKYLNCNNSYHYFKKNKGLIFTGPTHTNLMDIGIVLR